MNGQINSIGSVPVVGLMASLSFIICSCKQEAPKAGEAKAVAAKQEKPEYFLLRPDLEKMYGYTPKNASYRHQIYTRHFPTGSWIGVKELGLPDMRIEVEIEALIPQKK